MEQRIKICRVVSYVGIGLVLAVYIAMNVLAGNPERAEEMPGWLISAIQLLLGVGSALTISGVIMGLYYKGKSKRGGIKRNEK